MLFLFRSRLIETVVHIPPINNQKMFMCRLHIQSTTVLLHQNVKLELCKKCIHKMTYSGLKLKRTSFPTSVHPVPHFNATLKGIYPSVYVTFQAGLIFQLKFDLVIGSLQSFFNMCTYISVRNLSKLFICACFYLNYINYFLLYLNYCLLFCKVKCNFWQLTQILNIDPF